MALVLLVEDDPLILEFTESNLTEDGFDVTTAMTGAEALRKLTDNMPDVIVLDIMLPDMDGFEVCRRIRQWSEPAPLGYDVAQTPVIMLTAKAEDADKLEGFKVGADDYVTKPFNPQELAARINAVLRRLGRADEPSVIRIRSLTIDPQARTVYLRDLPLDLPPKEYELLYFLATHPNQVFSREELLKRVWEYSYAGDTRTVDVHVNRLRKKIEVDPDCRGLIVTEWTVGYMLKDKP